MLRSTSFFGRALICAIGGFFVAATPSVAAGKHANLAKFVVPKGDPKEAKLEKVGAKLLADYGAFRLWGVDESRQSISTAASSELGRVSSRIHLRGGRFQDTRTASPANASAKSSRAAADGGEFRVIQFIGPVRGEWSDRLRATGAKVVSYMPENAYVVWVGDATRSAFEVFSRSDEVQWTGNFEPSWRRSPRLDAARIGVSAQVDVTVQILDGPSAKATIAKLRSISTKVLAKPSKVLEWINVSVRTSPARISEIASWPDVFNVEPYVVPTKRDEVQGQIMAGNLTTTAGVVRPAGPGYLDWLESKGFPTSPASYPVVDVVDDGIDLGVAAKVRHPDFREFGDSGMASRVSYIGTCTSDPLGDGLDGHGNINAGIVGGYNRRKIGFPYQDDLGYNYGLGISPFGRIAGTRIFGSGGYYDVSACGGSDAGVIERSWKSGARLTSNSWGASVWGEYDASSQAYDAGTRDASGAEVGNQEILHVFSAGNSGSGLGSIGSPGTAKNVLTVGATENVRAEGVYDGCMTSESDNADDIIGFSSRGPTSDGRVKPDIMAPGVHITGPASQNPGFTGNSVCGMGAQGAYYPLGQTLYTWSSGTSHSCPAVAGAVQLAYEHYGRSIRSGAVPSPAMLKALVVNSARYLAGVSAGGDLPSVHQGWGDVNMGTLFDGTPRWTLDQTEILRTSGQEYSKVLHVADATKPVRISLVWTDAPGSTTGAAWVNDLDLEVVAGGNVYKGNVFKGALSVAGGTADARNNIENVFLAAGVSGAISVKVVARNIAGDGIPGNAWSNDQDFALVAYNASQEPRAILALDSVVVTKIVGDPSVGIEPGDSLRVRTAIRNDGDASLAAASGAVASSTATAIVGVAAAGFPELSPGGVAWGDPAYAVRVSSEHSCGDDVRLEETVVSGQDTIRRPILLRGRSNGGADTAGFEPRAIPDGGSTSIELPVAREGKVRSLRVRVGIVHPWDGDLELKLVSPSGRKVVLASRVGGSGDNFTSTVFDDTASVAIGSGKAPFSGRFRPASPLSAFEGDTVAGTWKLEVSDLSKSDAGSVRFFAIDFDASASKCGSRERLRARIQSPLEGSVAGDTVRFSADVSRGGGAIPGATVRWRLLSGPQAVRFDDSTSSSTIGRLRAEGEYLVEFAALDSGDQAADTISFQARLPLPAPTGLQAWSRPWSVELAWDSIPLAGVVYDIYRTKGNPENAEWLDSSGVPRYLDRPEIGPVFLYMIGSRRGSESVRGTESVRSWAKIPFPDPPSGVVAFGLDRKVRLTWNRSTFEGRIPTSTTIESMDPLEGVFQTLAEVAGRDTVFVDTGLRNGQSRSYRLFFRYESSFVKQSGYSDVVEAAPRPTLGLGEVRVTKVVGDPLLGVEPGDSIQVRVFIRNDGESGIDSLQGTISSDVSTVSVGQPGVRYGSLPPGGESWGEGAFGLRVSDSHPCGAEIPLDLDFRWGAQSVSWRYLLPGVATRGADTARNPASEYGEANIELPVEREGLVGGLKLRIGIRRAEAGGMTLRLVSPGGRAVALLDPYREYGAEFAATVFSDGATAELAESSSPYAGEFKPYEPLSAFTGESQKGLWRLEVRDNYSGVPLEVDFVSLEFSTERETCRDPKARRLEILAPLGGSVFAPNSPVRFVAATSGWSGGSMRGRWRSISGPSAVGFSDSGALSTEATMVDVGEYAVEFSMIEGSIVLADTVVVRIEEPLPVPTGIVAHPKIGAVLLEWDPIPLPGVAYEIQRAFWDPNDFRPLATTEGRSFLDENPGYMVNIFYRIAVRQGGRVSEYSQIVSTSEATRFATPPMGLVATGLESSVRLDWSSSHPGGIAPDSYRILRRSAVDGEFAEIATVPGTDTSYLDLGLENPSRTFYKVVAIYDSWLHEELESDSVWADPVGPPPALPAPTGVVAEGFDRRVRVRWNPVADADHYQVRFTDEPGDWFGNIHDWIGSTVYDIVGQDNDRPLRIVVVAVDSSGNESPFSEVVEAVPVHPAGKIEVLQKRIDANPEDGTMSVLFRIANNDGAPAKLSGIKLRYWYRNERNVPQSFWCDRSPVGTANVLGVWKKLAVSHPKATGYMEMSFRDGAGSIPAGSTTGDIQVRFTNADWSRYTGAHDWSFVPGMTDFVRSDRMTIHRDGALVWGGEPAAAMPKPTGLTASAGARRVRLGWNPVAGAVSYSVSRRTTDGRSLPMHQVHSASFVDSGLADGERRIYQVAADGGGGTGERSDSVVVEAFATVGGLVVLHRAGAQTPTAASLKPHIQIVNTGLDTVRLSSLAVRYWFTNDGTGASSYKCESAAIGVGNVSGRIVPVVPARPGADRYVEVSFRETAGFLVPGAGTGEIRGAVSKVDWSGFLQTDDASFEATGSVFSPSGKITVYRDGTLVWGTEP